MPQIADIACERLRRSPASALTYSAALVGLGEVIQDEFVSRAAQIAAFGEVLVVTVDLRTSQIHVLPEPSAPWLPIGQEEV